MNFKKPSTLFVFIFLFTLMIGTLGSSKSADAQQYCPSTWNPVYTRGVRFFITAQAMIGLVFDNSSHDALYNTDLLTYGFMVDARAMMNMFTLGLSGMFGWGNGNPYQVLDLHFGLNFTKTGTAYYKYILSRQYLGSVYGYNYRMDFTRTHYCNQTQGFARHHQLTAGPKFYFITGDRNLGMGAHLTYRYMEAFTRSQFAWYVDLQFNYANVNLFRGESDLANRVGGEVRFGAVYSYFVNALVVGYFQYAWTLFYTVGAAFWGV